MKIRLVWVGKTKERFILDGIRKYLKLIGPYAGVEIVEIRDEKGSDAVQCAEREGKRIMKIGSPMVLLDERGRQFTSVGFSRFLEQQGASVTFVLGGAFGVSDEVRAAARETVSLSSMTFPHELSRLVLLEQVYRAYTIRHRRGYHH